MQLFCSPTCCQARPKAECVNTQEPCSKGLWRDVKADETETVSTVSRVDFYALSRASSQRLNSREKAMHGRSGCSGHNYLAWRDRASGEQRTKPVIRRSTVERRLMMSDGCGRCPHDSTTTGIITCRCPRGEIFKGRSFSPEFQDNRKHRPPFTALDFHEWSKSQLWRNSKRVKRVCVVSAAKKWLDVTETSS